MQIVDWVLRSFFPPTKTSTLMHFSHIKLCNFCPEKLSPLSHTIFIESTEPEYRILYTEMWNMKNNTFKIKIILWVTKETFSFHSMYNYGVPTEIKGWFAIFLSRPLRDSHWLHLKRFMPVNYTVTLPCKIKFHPSAQSWGFTFTYEPSTLCIRIQPEAVTIKVTYYKGEVHLPNWSIPISNSTQPERKQRSTANSGPKLWRFSRVRIAAIAVGPTGESLHEPKMV